MSTALEPPATAPNQAAAGGCERPWRPSASRSRGWVSAKRSPPNRKPRPPNRSALEGQFLSAGKKLLDTRHPAFKAVTGVRSRLLAYWKGMTLPYPEPGIRLIRQADIAASIRTCPSA